METLNFFYDIVFNQVRMFKDSSQVASETKEIRFEIIAKMMIESKGYSKTFISKSEEASA